MPDNGVNDNRRNGHNQTAALEPNELLVCDGCDGRGKHCDRWGHGNVDCAGVMATLPAASGKRGWPAFRPTSGRIFAVSPGRWSIGPTAAQRRRYAHPRFTSEGKEGGEGYPEWSYR